MTPAARVAAAIGILDQVLAGTPAEQALTGWARGSRFAGARDRAAVRDLVFDGLRSLRSLTARAGAATPTGRAVMIGMFSSEPSEFEGIFSGQGYGPAPLSGDERAAVAAAAAATDDGAPAPGIRFDCPDWLVPRLERALGGQALPVMQAQRQRAPVFLRANLHKADRAAAIAALAAEGIATHPADGVETALVVDGNASKIRQSQAYLDGLVELQDLSSQAAALRVPLAGVRTVLDYCAGGGGKSLAIGARGRFALHAHDANPGRMRDLPARARRAGLRIDLVTRPALADRTFDLVLVDAPCSGSGTWRRTPDAKWRLTPEALETLGRLQAAILAEAARHVRPGGQLAYMTCSLLGEENAGQVAAFIEDHPGFRLTDQQLFTPLSTGDGFFVALLTRDCHELNSI